jgi:MFS transporter, DHA3 family, macrolide efflux protein
MSELLRSDASDTVPAAGDSPFPWRGRSLAVASAALCAALIVAIAFGAAAGLWFLPFAAGAVMGLVIRHWRARVMLPAAAVVAMVGWALPLAWQAVRGEPVLATARAVGGLAGLPASAALVLVLTAIVAAIQALAGASLARAVSSRPASRAQGLRAASALSTPSGFRAFSILWSGQFVSLIGSSLSSFALGVRLYQLTGSATKLGLVFACALIPSILCSPVAGALVDRWGRRRALLVSNCGYMVVSLALVLVLTTHTFAAWNVYFATIVNSALSALQVPAFGSTVPLLVPKRHIGRANGMLMLAISASQVLAPIAAGFLLLAIKLQGIVLIDCLSFGVAIITLLLVRIPRPRTEDGTANAASTTLLGDFAQSWRYVLARRGLVNLMILFGILCFLVGFVDVLFYPLVLAFASAGALGIVLTAGGIGMVVGSLAMSAWGGSRRPTTGVVGFAALLGVAVLVGALRPNVPLIAAAAFVFLGSTALIEGCYRSIWQTKTDPAMQGRVLALQNMITTAPQAVSYLLAGPLADALFQPLLGRASFRSGFISIVVGSGRGRGFALLLFLIGLLILASAAWGYLNPRIRHLEDELPDAVGYAPETSPKLKERKEEVRQCYERAQRVVYLNQIIQRLHGVSKTLTDAAPDENISGIVASTYDSHLSQMEVEGHVDCLQMDLPAAQYPELLNLLTGTFPEVKTIADPTTEELPWDDPVNRPLLSTVSERIFIIDEQHAKQYGIESVLEQISLGVQSPGGNVSIAGLDESLQSQIRRASTGAQRLFGLNRFYAADSTACRIIGGYADEKGSRVRLLAYHDVDHPVGAYSHELNMLSAIDAKKIPLPIETSRNLAALASWVYSNVLTTPPLSSIYFRGKPEYADDYDGNIVRVTPRYFTQLDLMANEVFRTLIARYSPVVEQSGLRILELGFGTGTLTGRLLKICTQFMSLMQDQRSRTRPFIELDGWDSNSRMVQIATDRLHARLSSIKGPALIQPNLANVNFNNVPEKIRERSPKYDLIVGSLFYHYWIDLGADGAATSPDQMPVFRRFLNRIRNYLKAGGEAIFLDVAYSPEDRERERREWRRYVAGELGSDDLADQYFKHNDQQYDAPARDVIGAVAKAAGFHPSWHDVLPGFPFRILHLKYGSESQSDGP